MYKYETHLHTSPVSRCAAASVTDTLDAYKSMGYDGVFITNHFLDGNINCNRELPYEEKINFYFSDYENALKYGKKTGIKVFLGVELSYKGIDFLIYGLDKDWYLNNPRIMEMKKKEELDFMRENGALVIQAHPFREASYIEYIRLFPSSVDGVEVINACRTDLENDMAKIYAEKYGLLMTAGTDNHRGGEQKRFAGMSFDTPIENEKDFILRVKNKEMKLFDMYK